MAVDPWAGAVAHLSGIDAAWADLIARVGPCTMRPKPDRFGTLVRAIVGQQISSKAAASINARLLALTGSPHDPAALLAAGESALRSVGLSGVKARYVLNLADAVHSGRVPLKTIGRLSDEDVIALLTSVKGVGVWTAEMFLMFSLARPDVFPVGDLGVRAALKNRYGLAEMPKPADCLAWGEPWRPFRSVASWYLWRSLEFPKVDQAEKEPPLIVRKPRKAKK